MGLMEHAYIQRQRQEDSGGQASMGCITGNCSVSSNNSMGLVKASPRSRSPCPARGHRGIKALSDSCS